MIQVTQKAKSFRSKKDEKTMHLHCNSSTSAHDVCDVHYAIFFTVYKNLLSNLYYIYTYRYRYIYRYIIVCKGVPPSKKFFLRQSPLDSACHPFLKSLFALPSFLFHPLLRYFRWFPQTSCNTLLA